MFVQLRNVIKVSALSLAVMSFCSSAMAAETPDSSHHNTASTTQAALPLEGQELDVALTIVPPFAFITESFSEVRGIDVDIVKELQKRTGFKLRNNRINVMNFGEMVSLGREGKLDVLGGGITLSDGRRAYYDFSDPYMDSALVLVTRKNDTIDEVADLKNRTLSVELGTTAVDYFPNAESLNIKIAESPTAFMSIYAVHDNQADALVMDEPMVSFYINNWRDADLKIVEQISDPSNLGLLFKKDAKFTPHLQEAYREMIEDGTMAQIIDKYVGKVVAAKKGS